MNKLNDGFKMKKLLIICILIIGIAFISGCVEEDTVPSAENVTPETPALIVPPYRIYIEKIVNIDNGTYFEITDDELKEYPELIRSISGEGCTKSDFFDWYCELNSDEFYRVFDFINMKHTEYLFSIDMKFENNLNDNIIGAELMNTFESNGFPLSENYSIIKSERNSLYDRWRIVEEANSLGFTIRKINDELKVYKSGYIDYQFTKIGGQYYEIIPGAV
jgi:hypothetical protein